MGAETVYALSYFQHLVLQCALVSQSRLLRLLSITVMKVNNTILKRVHQNTLATICFLKMKYEITPACAKCRLSRCCTPSKLSSWVWNFSVQFLCELSSDCYLYPKCVYKTKHFQHLLKADQFEICQRVVLYSPTYQPKVPVFNVLRMRLNIQVSHKMNL